MISRKSWCRLGSATDRISPDWFSSKDISWTTWTRGDYCLAGWPKSTLLSRVYIKTEICRGWWGGGVGRLLNERSFDGSKDCWWSWVSVGSWGSDGEGSLGLIWGKSRGRVREGVIWDRFRLIAIVWSSIVAVWLNRRKDVLKTVLKWLELVHNPKQNNTRWKNPSNRF